jgi:hypothetical protein
MGHHDRYHTPPRAQGARRVSALSVYVRDQTYIAVIIMVGLLVMAFTCPDRRALRLLK